MLDTTQQAILKSDILNTPALSSLIFSNPGAITTFYNTVASGPYVVWQTSFPVKNAYDQIIWANLTPNDAADGTTLWTNRSLACQGKQFNIQTLLQGRESIDASKTSLRAGLQDGLTQIPSGANGTTRSAGWVALQTAMQRNANNIEKLFATGLGTTASPSVMGFEGTVSDNDVSTALAS